MVPDRKPYDQAAHDRIWGTFVLWSCHAKDGGFLLLNRGYFSSFFVIDNHNKEKMDEKKENIYSNIDDMLNQSLKSEEE